jgi:hypothetical protein
MGFDKLLNYLTNNLNHDIIEEININSEIRKILANHVMFDISFILYQALIEIENEINDIIKIILGLPFSLFDGCKLEEKIMDMFSKSYWKNYITDNILEGSNEIEIIQNFLNLLKKTNILEKIIIDKIYFKINNFIKKNHYLEFILSINIIFDGIPSFSKVLEQRRRRLKNYIESKNRKLYFNNFFNDIDNSYYENNEIKFNFIKWIKYRFSIDKSFGPTSSFIQNTEIELLNKLKNDYPNLIININSGSTNGEADYKIFYEIYKHNYEGDIVIHTIDSDLVHQIIIQQNFYNLINKNINIAVLKYNNKDNNYVNYIDGNKLNKLLLNNYYNINQNITGTIEKRNKEDLNGARNINGELISNYLIIYDIALIFYFFGNDHLPLSFDLGSELSLDYYFQIHYKLFKNTNIISLNDKQKVILNINNLKLFLKEIYKNNNINKTKIILSRYFKLNYQLTTYLTDKLNLDFNKIILLCKKILFDSPEDDLDEDDLRYKLKNKYKSLDYPFDINKVDKVELNYFMNKLIKLLDISDEEDNYCGLPLYIKQFYFVDDKYENIYIHFNEIIINNLMKENPIIYDIYNIEDILNNTKILDLDTMDENINSYLKKIYHLVTTLFGDMGNYNPNNYTFYSGYNTPPLGLIINFLDKYPKIIKRWDNEINKETTHKNNYLNSINHHLIITPFISFYNLPPEIKKIIEHLEKLDNLWIEQIDTFNYRSIDIVKFFKIWNEALIKINLNSKTTKINEIILNNI